MFVPQVPLAALAHDNSETIAKYDYRSLKQHALGQYKMLLIH